MNIFLGLLGIIFGASVVVAILAFLLTLGVIQKIIIRTNTHNMKKAYLWVVTIGLFGGGYMAIFKPQFNIPAIIMLLVGLCIGAYIGILALSLAEVLKVLPIMEKKVNLIAGTKLLIIVVAAAKSLSSFYYFIKG